MRCLVTGGCGFVGSELARRLSDAAGADVTVLDSLRRAGAERNRTELAARGVTVVHGDVRCESDLAALGPFDWVIDAAAEPSVLAGAAESGGVRTTSRQLVEHNLLGTVNVLEAARRWEAGVVLLSTSRVYSIAALRALPLRVEDEAFRLEPGTTPGVTPNGVAESFTTAAPVSLYGATKLASEVLALEYAETFGMPLYVDRCGVLAGAGQFGHAEQGVFAFWIRSWSARRPLRYLGFGGTGHQVRDCLHPRDLARLVETQIAGARRGGAPVVVNVSGGLESATSLRALSRWCERRFGPHDVEASGEDRPFDVPFLVLDPSKAQRLHGWRPEIAAEDVFEEIAADADRHGG